MYTARRVAFGGIVIENWTEPVATKGSRLSQICPRFGPTAKAAMAGGIGSEEYL